MSDEKIGICKECRKREYCKKQCKANREYMGKEMDRMIKAKLMEMMIRRKK